MEQSVVCGDRANEQEGAAASLPVVDVQNREPVSDNQRLSDSDQLAVAPTANDVQGALVQAPDSSAADVNSGNKSVGSLGALGDLHVYDSDSDDVPEEVPHFVPNSISSMIPNKYRDMGKISDSDGSDSEESSTTSGESSSSSSEDVSSFSETESICVPRQKNTTSSKRTPPKTEGELLLDDLPPIEDLHITVPEDECMEVGKISAIVERMVVVQAHKNTPALDLESVLFLDKGRSTLGRIFDVIGPVCEPAYCVRFNSTAHIQEKGIEKGLLVYCAPKTDHTSYVFLGELLKMKGSDASWKANNEPPQELLDYSDDEEEKRARRKKRQASSSDGACSASAVVEPSSYERRMNAKNLARSQVPTRGYQQPSRGRGWTRRSVPGVVIQNLHSVPTPLEQFRTPPPLCRPDYAITRAQSPWPGQMPIYPSAIPPPYQFGMGTGPFFPMHPPPPIGHVMSPNLFTSPPPPSPPPPPNPYRHQHHPF